MELSYGKFLQLVIKNDRFFHRLKKFLHMSRTQKGGRGVWRTPKIGFAGKKTME